MFYCDVKKIYGAPVKFVVTCSWVVQVEIRRSFLDHRILKSDIYIYI